MIVFESGIMAQDERACLKEKTKFTNYEPGLWFWNDANIRTVFEQY